MKYVLTLIVVGGLAVGMMVAEGALIWYCVRCEVNRFVARLV